MKAALARAGYTALLVVALPFVFARWWWRGRSEPLYRAFWRERLGFGATLAPGGARAPRVWIHAVSLGETRAAEPLVAALRAARPGVQLLLTHGTATGRATGAALLQPGDAQAWQPYDTPGAVARFVRRTRPDVGVLMETEAWPNLLHGARAAGVPMLLANARLSQRSLDKGRRLRALMAPALAAVRRTLAQTEADAERLRAMGLREVSVMGNLKFDLEPDAALRARGRAWRDALARPVVLLAVSREGEEAMVFDAWCAALDDAARAASERRPLSPPEAATQPLLVVVPRHPQRFDEVAALAAQRFTRVARRSGWGGEPPPDAMDAQVWIGDSMREMPLYYGLADVGLLGGSFAPLGGQNLIEAAACGCPMLLGPHTFNFAQAADDAVQAGAAERVVDMAAAVGRARALLGTAERAAMAVHAEGFAAAHRGAAARMARAIVARLPA